MDIDNENNSTPATASSTEAQYAVRFSPLTGIAGWLYGLVRRSALHGAGTVVIEPAAVVLRGWQTTWLTVPLETELRIESDHIRNVVHEGQWVKFESSAPSVRRIRFRAPSEALAAEIAQHLPSTRSAEFDQNWSELRAFNEGLQLRAPRAWATPGLVIVNVLVFIALLIAGAGLWAPDPQLLTQWGSNVGQLVMSGQWYRLFTALFLHGDLIHLTLNMWVLWGAGRLVERLYGTATFLFIYFVSGIFAGLASVAWNPYHGSVGASGAIFAVLGALVVFMLSASTRVPKKIVRAQGLSALLFTLYSGAIGMLNPNVDNAAHVGGLICGCLLGWLLARPLDAHASVRLTLGRASAAGVTALLALGLGAGQIHALSSNQSAVQRYWGTHQWFLTGQAEVLRTAAEVQARASTGTISEEELTTTLEQKVLPFWKDADARLLNEAAVKDEEQQKFAALMIEYVKLRNLAVAASIEGIKGHDRERLVDGQGYAREADFTLARLTRLEMRAEAGQVRSWSQSGWVKHLRYAFASFRWQCAIPLTAKDATTWDPSAKDGIAGRVAGGCAAQRAFETGDYELLDAMLHPKPEHLADLIDGDSRLSGFTGGLDELFGQRQSVDSALSRLADWRRERPGSDGPDLVEAILFRTSAWQARGHGFAKSVSPQQWAIYSQRLAMAEAALQDAQRGAESSPIWYQLSVSLGADASVSKDKLRATFDSGVARYSNFYPLYTVMLRTLMPRWGGSYVEMDDFIEAMAQHDPEHGSELYARLYSTFAGLEGDELNMFQSAFAKWARMKEGYQQLTTRYPDSEFLKNSYAAFACRAGDKDTYREAKAAIGNIVAGAWTEAYSVTSCDQKFQ